MSRSEPLEPEVLAALEAIDATLEGEPVDPDFAELAELSLILRADAPTPSDAFLARLDGRVGARFAAPVDDRSPVGWARRVRRGWAGAGALAAAVTVVVVLLVVAPWSGGGPSVHPGVAAKQLSVPESGTASSSAGSGGSSNSASSGGGTLGAAGSASTGGSAQSSTNPASAPSHRTLGAKAPAPHQAPGRQIAESANLALVARAGRLDAVAQEVFDVVGAEHGHVMSSHVVSNASAPGQASFSLQVPSARLQATLDRLSRLNHARVVSREDSSQDITAQIGGAAQRLGVARALRHSLLHQLATAYTTTEIDHIQTELHRNAAQIARDETTLSKLHGRVSDSAIRVTVTAPAPRAHHHAATGSGFTLHSALHDAARVLLVAAGVLLIAVAVLIPVALLVALAAWVWTFVLRRRREGALEP